MDIGYAFVAAGSDDDNNGYICEEGEFCGFYPVFSDSETISVEANRTIRNIDFGLARRVSPALDDPASWRKMGFDVPRPGMSRPKIE